MLIQLILAPIFYFLYFYVGSINPLGWLIISLYLFTMLVIVLYKKDTSIGNFTWGGGVLLITLYSFFQSIPQAMPWGVTPRKILITSLISLWAFRLIIYLYLRYKKGADPRFVKWSEGWGKFHILASFIWIVIMQGALMLIMSFPSVLVNSTDMGKNLNQIDFMGFLVWIIGFFFESVGDYQLYAFLKNPNNIGKIMDQGLWKYTRHPNYFGEIAMWWGIYLITLSTYDGFYTIIAPLTITILLVFITGVPLAESVFKNNPEYKAYKKRTNMLIPGFPKD